MAQIRERAKKRVPPLIGNPGFSSFINFRRDSWPHIKAKKRNRGYKGSKSLKAPSNDEPSEIHSNGDSVAYTTDSSRNETKYENTKEKYLKRAREVKGWAIGPMPEELFLHFLPYNGKNPPSIEAVVRSSTVDILREDN